PGYLGIDSARSDIGITVSYWADEASIAAWRAHAEHTLAHDTGRARWYDRYELRVAKVERAYTWSRAG
ncbi:MAG: antibiotic biosynthesis monooxygenase family protein, partial [Ilumatobacteraceae bacterium]